MARVRAVEKAAVAGRKRSTTAPFVMALEKQKARVQRKAVE
jgi:hypothetical protein